MEIANLPKNSLRIKSKLASLVIDQQDTAEYNASLVLGKSPKELTFQDASVVITAPGEYEVGGIKISGSRADAAMIYTMNVDSVEIVIGQMTALSKMQNKLTDNNIVIVLCDTADNASFLTSLVTNVIVLYGEKAEEVSHSFAQEKVKRMAKYSSTLEKLPTEVETILLT